MGVSTGFGTVQDGDVEPSHSGTMQVGTNAPDGNRTAISSAMEEKILLGQRVINGNGVPTNRVRGGHSPEINNSNANYAVEVLQSNSNGT
jgi:hypothetical protein